ncbi:hypothetical protein ACFQY4_17150 [Catellatospora bangladeshensis]|uniref:DUF3618 domain-containing protein n=1 Tax=Catellatospora bangladeshensis TaxID=310355 RepID=A0A8J3JNX5_9ACTN|nr:hypothetical protein [Catellatospora bangladeshensis]GIF84172.1 hypothetical protein Cba03nite_55210 [Catellatospora bangladeshensis]
MPPKDKNVEAAVDQVTQRATDAGAAVAERADEVRQTLTATGREIADKAATLKDEAGTAALAVKDRTVETAGLVKDHAAELAHDLADRMPRSTEQWEALGRDLRDRIRANPTPWAVGAAAVLVAYLVGRRATR